MQAYFGYEKFFVRFSKLNAIKTHQNYYTKKIYNFSFKTIPPQTFFEKQYPYIAAIKIDIHCKNKELLYNLMMKN